MLNKKLNKLIQKYGVYDALGEYRVIESKWKWKRFFFMAIGLLYLVRPLNKMLEQIEDRNIAVCGYPNKLISLCWRLILPKNKKKIRFLVTKMENTPDEFFGRNIVDMRDVASYSIQNIVLFAFGPGLHADLLACRFEGTLITLRSLIYDNRLEKFFEDACKEDPYADIYIARKYRDMANDKLDKQLWHQKLIGLFLRARDFLGMFEEIEAYEKSNYEDAEKYSAFRYEVEELLAWIHEQLAKREQRDVLIFWLDQMEKEEFFAMKWVGNNSKGRVFRRAYTTMTHTRAILHSILMGKNVKSGRLMKYKKPGLQDTLFFDGLGCGAKLTIFSSNFFAKLQDNLLHECCRNYMPANDVPSMVGFWNALDTLLTTPKSNVFIFHCMETHCFYPSAVVRAVEGGGDFSSADYSKVAKKTRDYLDQQLEWYHAFFSPNDVCIYMSDHGNEFDLSEQNVNIPFKIVGKGITQGKEDRIFSYKNLYKLVQSLLFLEGNIDNAFEKEAVIDMIDVYEREFLNEYIKKGRLWEHFSLKRFKRTTAELKQYLQTTKVVTDEGEYYTINILGEETYYRDKECKVNLVDDPTYMTRIAELRGKAGKFYNPWKEKKQVAIDFYEYLGIQEKDIDDQCY